MRNAVRDSIFESGAAETAAVCEEYIGDLAVMVARAVAKTPNLLNNLAETRHTYAIGNKCTILITNLPQTHHTYQSRWAKF